MKLLKTFSICLVVCLGNAKDCIWSRCKAWRMEVARVTLTGLVSVLFYKRETDFGFYPTESETSTKHEGSKVMAMQILLRYIEYVSKLSMFCCWYFKRDKHRGINKNKIIHVYS